MTSGADDVRNGVPAREATVNLRNRHTGQVLSYLITQVINTYRVLGVVPGRAEL